VHDEGRGELEDLQAVLNHIKTEKFILAGFSFGGSRAAKLAERAKPEWLVLVGVGITRIMAPPVPPGTLVIHGESDETVPLAAVMDWARPQELPVVVVPGADHFFHRKLHILRALVERNAK
jgi:alpha/beta superfamily hydrolase